MFDEYKDILSVIELCEALGIGKNTAYKLINSGQIKSIKVGATHKIPKVHLIDFVLNNAQNCA